MLDRSRTRVKQTREMYLLSTAVITQEGLCLRQTMESGLGKCLPTDGTQTTNFAGISWGDRFPSPTTFPNLEQLTIGAASGVVASVKLQYPVSAAGTLLVLLGTGYGGSALTGGVSTTPDTSHYHLGTDSQTITVHSDNAGLQLFVIYRYALTVAQALMMFGETYPGMGATAQTGKAGMIVKGVVYTDRFDTSVDWATVNDLTSGNVITGAANGIFTVTASNGTNCSPYVYVQEAPSVGLPYLGLYVDR